MALMKRNKMTSQQPTKRTGDKKKQALTELCHLLEKYPEKSRQTLLQQVEIKFDLTPKECEFLNRNFQAEKEGTCQQQ
ncbi:MAG TPA: hypothetical protein EYP35_02225 [Desulfobacterales bacterium]|nr:hypothetical protein [Desulfobacterales bacterium]